MPLDRKLLEALACPKCKGSLQLVDGDRSLLCGSCQLKFPVRDGVPHLIVNEAEDLSNPPKEQKGLLAKPAFFRVMSGSDRQMTFTIESGKCRGIGRSSTNLDKTSVFAVDFTLSLDDSTRRLIINYVSQQFKKMKEGEFGGFSRANDVILSDPNLSRLHAMMFYDGERVGILDLVSKNGTYVNGREIESTLLEIGDVLEMGETKIIREGR